METITGTLTDYALMDEGQYTGYYGARIDDKPYVVMHHVDAYLLRISKGESVEANLNKDGHINKIQRRKSTSPAKQTTETTRTAAEIEKEREDYNAKAKSCGFGEPTTGPAKTEAQKTIEKENAEGDQRMAENNEYLRNLTGVQPQTEVLPAQTFRQMTPSTHKEFDKDQIALIKATVARGCTDTEFELLMYLAAQYQLDPIRRQIWAVKYGNNPASIFTGRDGFLEIAHRSGVFDGMESGIRKDGDELVGWCKVYRKDMSHAFFVEVYEKEYTTGKSLWLTKPRIMIQKVAESSCLRRAFSVSGLYCPEEMPEQPGAS